ncbi:jg9034 [Pararge aegeria aegeria]|uniref:Jg9034 protein n=1 Tax=Pararge aegeria aegeria TaxID=348720 RepID=A0A8S4REG0_9NEOP|nr:jg9034 [Pararge aegeria aegeria]
MCKGVKGVDWETETLMGSPPPVSKWERFIPRAALSHIGLFVALMLYTAGGGLVSAVEFPSSSISDPHFPRKSARETSCIM